MKSILDEVSQQAPALEVATKLQQNCAKYGFDWDEMTPVIGKVREEITEVEEEIFAPQQDKAKIFEEFGDLLFAIVNLARHLDINPEEALRYANAKFTRRFQGVEQLASATSVGAKLTDYSLEELDRFWEQVKAIEKKQSI